MRRYASAGCCRRVSLSVCLSVTLRYCIKTAKRKTTQIMLHDSPMTSFLTPKITAKFELDHIFVVGQRRYFKIWYTGRSQHTDYKQSMKGAWLLHVIHFKFVGPIYILEMVEARAVKCCILIRQVTF